MSKFIRGQVTSIEKKQVNHLVAIVPEKVIMLELGAGKQFPIFVTQMEEQESINDNLLGRTIEVDGNIIKTADGEAMYAKIIHILDNRGVTTCILV